MMVSSSIKDGFCAIKNETAFAFMWIDPLFIFTEV